MEVNALSEYKALTYKPLEQTLFLPVPNPSRGVSTCEARLLTKRGANGESFASVEDGHSSSLCYVRVLVSDHGISLPKAKEEWKKLEGRL
jgi:hypothetical protein